MLAALDEAAAVGILAAGSFGHDLIREVARLELPTADRLAVHARMADYLRRQPGVAPALVAYHLLESLPVGSAPLAGEWAERAAEAAMEQLAWEDAAAWYAKALRIPESMSQGRRCRLLLGLAVARLRGFDLAGGSGTLREAAAAARSAGDPALVGEVALAMEGYSDPAWVTLGKQLCDEALAGLPAGDSPLRARLLARRAAEAIYHGEPEADPLSAQALAMAERLGDPRALRSALRARQVARGGPDGALDRVTLGSRMLALGVVDGDEWLPPSLDDFGWSPPFGTAMRALWHLDLGRLAEARECYQRDEVFAAVPGIRHLVTFAMFAELASALDDAEAASAAYEALLPYADLFVCGGAGLTMLDGSVQRYLGLAALACGRSDDAVRHLRAAVSANEREGLAACAALAIFDLARALAPGASAASGRVRPTRPTRPTWGAWAAWGRRGGGGARRGGGRHGLATGNAPAAALGPLPCRRAERIRGRAADQAGGRDRRAGGPRPDQPGAALHISERTAENHVQHILTKLGLNPRTQIATWAVSRDL